MQRGGGGNHEPEMPGLTLAGRDPGQVLMPLVIHGLRFPDLLPGLAVVGAFQANAGGPILIAITAVDDADRFQGRVLFEAEPHPGLLLVLRMEGKR